jgi:FAD/FMN-containing dehydrogenase
VFHLGGQIARLPADHSAASGRDADHTLVINAAWPDGGPAHPDIGWCRDTFRAKEPHATGAHATGAVYVNFVHNDEGEARVRAAYGQRYQRLASLKTRYDPRNVFRNNQDIPGAG